MRRQIKPARVDIGARSQVRFGTLVGAIALAWSLTQPSTGAHAELLANGPIVAVGFSEKLGNDMVIPSLGWRWRLGPGETIRGWGERVGTDFSFVIEPMAAGIFGDEQSFEAQVVPFARAEFMRELIFHPYIEAGIGLIYTDLDHLHLGSHFHFSSNVGVGLSFDLSENRSWSRLGAGYRIRHISHAGLFGEPNSGMNTHYLVLTLE
jgi:hypothetical protein